MSIARTAACLVALVGSVSVCAQQSTDQPSQAQRPQAPTPDQMKQMMQATMGAMVNVMGPMTEAVIEAQLEQAAKPETAERIATFKKNLYDALLKKGFSAARAFQIVLSAAPPSASPATK
jgi:4-hydroxy-3-methylbut-2-en-1-yl diphosphate synthase IspG/GcpE